MEPMRFIFKKVIDIGNHRFFKTRFWVIMRRCYIVWAVFADITTISALIFGVVWFFG